MQLAVRSKAQHLLLSPRAPDLDSECRPFLSPAVPTSCSGLGSLSPSSVLRRGAGRAGESSAEAQQGGAWLLPAPNKPVSASGRLLYVTVTGSGSGSLPGPDALSVWCVHAVWQSSLTLTVSSGREVAAASFPRAAESGYTAHAGTLQRWRLTQPGRGERSKAPLPARASPELPYSPTQGHPQPPALSLGPQASGPSPPWPTVRPSSGTFLQRLSLAWGEDRPIPVACPWVGTPGCLGAARWRWRNWSQNSCKGRQWLVLVCDGDSSGRMESPRPWCCRQGTMQGESRAAPLGHPQLLGGRRRGTGWEGSQPWWEHA